MIKRLNKNLSWNHQHNCALFQGRLLYIRGSSLFLLLQQAVDCCNVENNLHITRLRRKYVEHFLVLLRFHPVLLSFFMLYYVSLEPLARIGKQNYTAVFLNSSNNPLLYCWSLCNLRAAVVKTVRRMLWR